MWCRALKVTPSEGRALVARDHLVDQSVLERLVGLEKAVALHVAVDLLDGPAGVVGVDMLDPPHASS